VPTETTIAARNPDGAEIFYHDTPYPPVPIVELFECHRKGSAGDFLEMVKAEQSVELANRDRTSRIYFFTRIAGLCFAFVLILALIGTGTYLIATDKPLGGYASLILGLLSAITAIAAGGKSQKQ
jgi:hypothetical protein